VLEWMWLKQQEALGVGVWDSQLQEAQEQRRHSSQPVAVADFVDRSRS